jgi:hypothetical protein
MTNEIFLYLGSLFTVIWGVSHIFPTKSVVSGFGEISIDNKHIITMEWIVEGVALIFIGVLVSIVTSIDSGSNVSIAVYLTSSATLIILALVSLATGFKVNFLPYKLCPFIFGASALLLLAGAFL